MPALSMQFDFVTILELGGILWAAFWLVGLSALWLGRYAARREFRGKGYVRPPSGRAWFPFLLEKQYAFFESPNIRFFFGISHFCLIAMFVITAAILLLVGCDTLFKNIGEP